MKKEAYFKLMGLKKRSAEKDLDKIKNSEQTPNFYSTGIPETPTQQAIFIEQGAKKNPLSLLAQKQIADKLSKKWRDRISLGHQFKRWAGFTDDSADNYYNRQTAKTLFNPSEYPVYDIKYGVPFIDDVRNWWRFLTKGK